MKVFGARYLKHTRVSFLSLLPSFGFRLENQTLHRQWPPPVISLPLHQYFHTHTERMNMAQKRKRQKTADGSGKQNKKQKQHQNQAITDRNKTQSKLLSLPPGLRNAIYEYTYVRKKPINVIPRLKQPALLRACRQTRKESLKLWCYSNKFALRTHNCDTSLLIKFESHLKATGVDDAEILMALYGKDWSKLMVWCKAIWEQGTRGMNDAERSEDYDAEEAVIRAAHRIAMKADFEDDWARCEEELAELRFVVSRFDGAWLR